MSQTYRHAWLNISADLATDPSAGLLTDKSALEVTWPEIEASRIGKPWILTPSSAFYFEWMDEAPSFKRAWIHRERQLSRRILHFTSKEMIWECCGYEGTSFASESFPGGAPYTDVFGNDHKFQIGRLNKGLVKGDEETYAAWNDLCEALSSKALTRETDRAIVLSSLAEDFAPLLPDDEFVAGLWRTTLPYTLLWATESPVSKLIERHSLAPSWSWLSVGVSAKLANRSRLRQKGILVEVKDCSKTLMRNDPYGPTPNASLTLLGYLRRVSFSYQGDESNDLVLMIFDDDDTTNVTDDFDANEHGKQQADDKAANRTHKNHHNDEVRNKEEPWRQRVAQRFKGRSKTRQEHDCREKPHMKPQNGSRKREPEGQWRTVGDEWNEQDGIVFDLRIDNMSDYPPRDCFALFTALDQFKDNDWGSKRSIDCLLLQCGMEEQHFSRIGTVTLKDEAALKARYKMRQSSDDRNGEQDWAHARKVIQRMQDERLKLEPPDEDNQPGLIQGPSGLYQYDAGLRDEFPWLVELQPQTLHLI